jgi:hypothetical protein
LARGSAIGRARCSDLRRRIYAHPGVLSLVEILKRMGDQSTYTNSGLSNGARS